MRNFLFPFLLVAAGLLAYSNSFSAPFLFDDAYYVLADPRIRDLAHPLRVLTGTSRPVVSLTLALNVFFGGFRVWGYHAVNVCIHLAAGWVLLGLLRRTFESGRLRERWGSSAARLALAAALIWTLHPLQTQSVTYIIQRSESLMGLFYLLTLVSLRRGWNGRAVAFCALGMATKPVMVTAPLAALLYDRVFLATSWREIFGRRGRLHLALASTWILLPLLLWSGSDDFRGDVGFHLREISSTGFIAVQPGVLLHYLKLSLWPHPLVFDYGGWPAAQNLLQILLPTGAVLALLFLTFRLLKRAPPLGFLAAWFFLILAPTSSFLPIADPVFEQRMYLPLAAVAVGAVLAVEVFCRRLAGGRARAGPLLFWMILLPVILGLGAATYRRNQDYRSTVSIWSDTVAKRPGNARAHNNLAYALWEKGRLAEAEQAYRRAIELDPASHKAHKGLGNVLHRMGRLEEAIAEYRESIRLNSNFPDAQAQLDLAVRALQAKSGSPPARPAD